MLYGLVFDSEEQGIRKNTLGSTKFKINKGKKNKFLGNGDRSNDVLLVGVGIVATMQDDGPCPAMCMM